MIMFTHYNVKLHSHSFTHTYTYIDTIYRTLVLRIHLELWDEKDSAAHQFTLSACSCIWLGTCSVDILCGLES